jgi:hypothetical protein
VADEEVSQPNSRFRSGQQIEHLGLDRFVSADCASSGSRAAATARSARRAILTLALAMEIVRMAVGEISGHQPTLPSRAREREAACTFGPKAMDLDSQARVGRGVLS